MKRNLSKLNNGFTLVEIMVATSIFMMIMLMALGMLVSISDQAKKSRALRTAMDNVNFAMESMTRSLRMGTLYTCGSSETFNSSVGVDCSGGDVALSFAPATITLSRTAAYKHGTVLGKGVIAFCTTTATPACTSLTSSDVDIQKLTFFLSGSTLADKIQPNIYILVKGVVTTKLGETPFAIQTFVTQRSAE